MTPSEAAEIIGCTANNVRYMIRTGKIKAEYIERKYIGWHWSILRSEVDRYRDKPQTRGFPRGRKRT